MSAWAPVSACTPGCSLHAAGQLPLRRSAARAAALLRTLAGACAAGGRIAEPPVLRAYARRIADSLGVRLEAGDGGLSVPGAATGTLVVANHISWLDVIALLAVEPVTVLAKREVGEWPLVGPLVRRAGTEFIDRGSLRSLPATVAALTGLLRQGRTVLVFPQGVTWCSGPGGAFRRAAFQSAVDAGAPVRPVTLSYTQHGAPSTVAAFVGEDTFGASLRRVLSADSLAVRVRVHDPVRPDASGRRALAARAQEACGGGPPARTVRSGHGEHGPAEHGPAGRYAVHGGLRVG